MVKKLLLTTLATATLLAGLLIAIPSQVFAEPAQCSFAAMTSGKTACSNVASFVSGVQFLDDHCYNINGDVGAPLTAAETPCQNPPFASNFVSVTCADTKVYTGNGKTPEEICKDHGGLPMQSITCLDGISKTVPPNVDDKAKIDACKANCGYNTTGGAVDTPECKQLLSKPPAGAGGGGTGSTAKPRLECNNAKDCIDTNPLIVLINKVINLVSIAVGVIVVIMIIVGGIEYSSAGGNPNKTAEAKKRIINAIMAFVMYIFLFAFLSWLVPGGVLR